MEGKKIRWQDGIEALWTLIKYRFKPARAFDRRQVPARQRVASAGLG
jgi:hypothetical protein